ncbi:unnamed protein product, partial [Symbiodinium pilosum]
MTLRALLVKMIQHKCPHIQTTKSGSNGHTVKVRRMACNHLVEDRPRRQDEKAESRTSRAKAKLRANPSPSIPTSSSITSSQSEADLLEEYQHQVQNQRDRTTSTCHTDWWQHAGKEHVFASNWNLLQPLLLGKETPVDLVQVARKLAALEHGLESDDVYIYNLRDQRAATRRTLENYWVQLHEHHQDIPKFERVQPQHPLHTVLPIEEEALPEDENIPNGAEDEQGQPAEDEDASTVPLPGSRARTLQQLVQKAHEGLGHPHLEQFLRILKGAKATKEVIQAAKQLRCSVCQKFSQTRPPRRAAPPRELGINEVVGAVWRKFFGPPKQVWADQGGEFKGSFKQRLSDDGTHLEVSSLESPFQRGTVERHGKTFKAILEKTMLDVQCDNHATWRELVDTTVMIKNRLATRGGFSPVQRVLGYLPRLPGGLMTDEGTNSPDAGDLDPGDEGVARAMRMRKAAAQAFYEVDCDQALKTTPQDIVNHNGGLVKASPERIRPASEEEQLTVSGWLEGLVRARREFEEDNEEDADRDPLVPVRRARAKVSTEDVPFERVPLPAPVPPPAAAASEMDTKAAMDNDHEADEHDPTSRPSATRTRDSVDDENDEESGERPSKRSRIELLEVYYAKLETLFKTRQRKEVRAKDLPEPDRQAFQRAMAREIRNNLDTKAYQILDEVESEIIRGTKPDRIMESRYVKTAKPLEQCDIDKAVMDGVLLQGDHGGPCKAKVRHVMKGFSEDGAEELDSATPQVTREGWDRLKGIISVATDDLLHGGDEEHQERMKILNEKYKLGKFQYGSGRFAGKQFSPQPDGSILIDQEHYVKEKVQNISLSRVRRSQRYSFCNETEIGWLRSLVGALSWLAKETRPDLSGRVALLQQSFPKPRIKDILAANIMANDAVKNHTGIKVMPIPLEKLRVSVATDASWGNAQDDQTREANDVDYWVETPKHWVRYHRRPRRSVYHPGMSDGGPDLHQLSGMRVTKLRYVDGEETEHRDEWNKVVNTLSAECQSLVAGIGNVHWHRFLMKEAQESPITDQDWEAQLS